MILLDTNILVRLANNQDADYQMAHRAVAGCWRQNQRLLLSDQALYEFWVVATRSTKKNGLGFTAPKADRFMDRFCRIYSRLPDQPNLLDAWRALVNQYNIQGLRAYDARFVAFMQTHHLTHFMTFNLADFQQFPITLVNPNDASTW